MADHGTMILCIGTNYLATFANQKNGRTYILTVSKLRWRT